MDPNSAQSNGAGTSQQSDGAGVPNANQPSSLPPQQPSQQTQTPPVIGNTSVVTISTQPSETQNIQQADQQNNPISTPSWKDKSDAQEAEEKPKRSLKKPLLIGLFVLLFFLVIAAGGAVYAVAYNKIDIRDQYPNLQKQVAGFVMSLPFTPKTPEFLLIKTARAHQDVSKQSFDMSLAIGSPAFEDPLGLKQLDFQIKGDTDYSDPKNLIIDANISLTKGFNLDLRSSDPIIYFKINELPSFILAFIGLTQEDFAPVMNQWFAYDSSPLDTEARRYLEDKEVENTSDGLTEEIYNKYLDDQVLNAMKVEAVEEDGIAVYKITMDADSALIDHIGDIIEQESNNPTAIPINVLGDSTEKLSDYVKTFRVEIYIDKKDYYTRKAIFDVNLEFDSSDFAGLTGSTSEAKKSRVSIVFAAKFDDFGKDVVVEIPTDTLSFDEFTVRIADAISQIYGQLSGGNLNGSSYYDITRASDLSQIQFALETYKYDCGVYPDRLETLTNPSSFAATCTSKLEYFTTIPSDPATNIPYYYQADNTTYNLCGSLDQLEEELNTCPNPDYNTHLQPFNISPLLELDS